MSLILEALRKSEAERRRGLPPDLHAELPPIAQPARAVALPWPWLAGAVALAAAAALAWAVRGLGTTDAGQQAPAVGAVASATLAEAERPLVETAAISVPDQTSAPANSPMRRMAPPPVAPAKPAQAVVVAREALQQPPPEPPRAEPRTDPVTDASPATNERRFAEALPARDPAPTNLPVAAPTTGAAARETPPAMRLADLAPGERGSLPALKISMHMWNPTAAQRFAIIDGQRVGEGSRVGDAVVEEITRDGVVLAWQGRQLTVPIR